MTAINKYEARVKRTKSLLCVGLDSDFNQIPERFKSKDHPQFAFNRWIIEQTHEFVAAYKPNLAFYEARGEQGWQDLALTMEYLRDHHPDIFTIADAKRADIGSTNLGYVTALYDELGFDAVTLHPYLGQEALTPFLARPDKAAIILCKTSNPGGGELQDLPVGPKQKPLWQIVAEKVSGEWNTHGNCMLVVGATYPKQLAQVRQIVGKMTILVPGVGAQGGDLAATLSAGLNSTRQGLIINSSRGVIFADNPREAARQLWDEIRTNLRTGFNP